MIASLALVSLIANPLPGLHAPHFGPRNDIHGSAQRVQGWKLEVSQDQFAGRTVCTLSHGPITVRHGVAEFRFSGSTNTANAEVRIDGGAAAPAGSMAVEAAGLGARFGGQNLKNPSDGRVEVPLRLVANAATVSIRPDMRSSRRDYSLKGLSQALAAAEERGCDITPATPAPHA